MKFLRVEPDWLPVENIISINRVQVEATGERHLLASAALLESAAFQPRNIWFYKKIDDILVLSAGFIAALAKDHPFEQGNKRTALVSGLMFLELNGFQYDGGIDQNSLAQMVLALVSGNLSVTEFADLLRPHIKPDDT